MSDTGGAAASGPDGGGAGSSEQEGHVAARFGAQAQAYVASAVHAQGADLDALAALVAARPRAARLLDLGCGGGHVAYACAPHVAEVVAFDLSPAMLAAVARTAAARGLANIRTAMGSAGRLPFDTGGFDWVATRFSAHHWADMPAGLAEAARVLRPGGTLVVIDTIAPAEAQADSFLQAIELLRDPSHARNYRLDEWRAAAAACGLAVAGETCRRMRLDFASWTARMATPPAAAAAIRALQAAVPPPVRARFEVDAEGSFTIDTVALELRHAGGG